MDIGNIYKEQGEALQKIGNNVEAKNKFLASKKLCLLSLKMDEKNGDKSFTALICVSLANLEVKLKEYETANKYLQKALLLAKELGFKIAIRDTYSSLSDLESVKGNYKEAYNYYKNYIVYRDSVVNNEYKEKSVKLQMQYEFDKRESLVTIKQAKKDAESQRSINRQYTLIGLLLLMILIFLTITYFQWRNNQQKKKATALLQRQRDEINEQRIQLSVSITDLKTTQTQLIQSEKMASLGELTAGIAHEIQNPLNFVNNFSDVSAELVGELEEEQQRPNRDPTLEAELLGDLRENLKKISLHGGRASNIVKGMLEHARTSTGERQPTDVNALTDEYLRLAYHGHRAKDKHFTCDLITDFAPDLGQVNVVPQEIGRVLLNLFNNAFYAVSKRDNQPESTTYQPTVEVTTHHLGDHVVIRIRDNGTGIPESVKAKIFQPFFTTKPTGEGTGLGLSLSYDIVTKGHGGTLEVLSKEGEGTEFVITI